MTAKAINQQKLKTLVSQVIDSELEGETSTSTIFVAHQDSASGS